MSSHVPAYGESRSLLTGTDTSSWADKSWVVGVTLNGVSRAYDWNRLERERVIADTLGGRHFTIELAADSASFFAYAQDSSGTRVPISASQEFWHSWRTFQPATTKY